MTYSIIISTRAQAEIESAYIFYHQNSRIASRQFMQSLELAYNTLSANPFFAIHYKNVRALKLLRFPVSLFFTVDEKRKIIKVLSCFHNSRNPNNRP